MKFYRIYLCFCLNNNKISDFCFQYKNLAATKKDILDALEQFQALAFQVDPYGKHHQITDLNCSKKVIICCCYYFIFSF